MPRGGSSRPPNCSLYVRNVPDGARQEELKSMFSKYGYVSDVYIPLDYYTRRPRGFAYVQFDDPRDAEDALYNLHHVRYYGTELEVEYARSDRKSPGMMRTKDRGGGYSSHRSYSRERYSRDRYSRERDDDYDYDRRRRERSYSRSPRRHRSRSPRESNHRSYSRSRSPSDSRRYAATSSRRERRRSYSRD